MTWSCRLSAVIVLAVSAAFTLSLAAGTNVAASGQAASFLLKPRPRHKSDNSVGGAATAPAASEPADAVAPDTASTQPAAPPATAPASSVTVKLSPQLAALLKQIDEGRAIDALPALLEMSRSFPKSVRDLSDEQVIALHALGVCYMSTGEPQKARDPIDRAFTSSRTCRTLVINRAKLDLQFPGLVVRAVQELDKALATYGIDEPTLNLMGYGINAASSRAGTAGDVRRYVDKYRAYEKQLESTRPGMRRWGAAWLHEREYQRKTRPAVLVDEETWARRRLEDAERRFKLAQTEYEDLRRQAFLNQRDDSLRRRMDNAAHDAREASAEVDRCQSRLNDVEARFPKPEWTADFQPVLPETTLRAEAR